MWSQDKLFCRKTAWTIKGIFSPNVKIIDGHFYETHIELQNATLFSAFLPLFATSQNIHKC